MEKKDVLVNPEELVVEDGKVIISSEELASAIQNYDFDLTGEEEANSGNCICIVFGVR